VKKKAVDCASQDAKKASLELDLFVSRTVLLAILIQVISVTSLLLMEEDPDICCLRNLHAKKNLPLEFVSFMANSSILNASPVSIVWAAAFVLLIAKTRSRVASRSDLMDVAQASF
jgi:hypothetical protein